MSTRPLLLLLLFLAVHLGGCCSLSRLFCGPDRSPWVPQRFDTPRRTAQTLFESLRRDDPEVLFLCLDRSYRRRLGIGDSMVMRVAWERFREQNPGLHVAGYTEVPEPIRRDADHATVAVDVVGTVVDLDFERRCFWEIRYRTAGNPPGEPGGELRAAAEALRVVPLDDAEDNRSRLEFAPLVFPHGFDPVPVEAIEHVAITHRWLVTDIRERRSP
ncbi:MAG: hypothetical protein KF830_16895 [Planctomycetes bacterium]|nr:hypothetical protein [Planctomycetota bacterium]